MLSEFNQIYNSTLTLIQKFTCIYKLEQCNFLLYQFSWQERGKMNKRKMFDYEFRNTVDTLGSNPMYAMLSKEEREKVLKKRIQRFCNVNQEIDVAEEYYKHRIQPECQNSQPSNDTLMIFGIDFLKPAELKQKFSRYLSQGEKFSITFLDRSNCLIYFSSAETARRNLLENVKKNSQTAFKVEEDASFNQDIFYEEKLPKGWIELNQYLYEHRYDIVSPTIFKMQVYPRKWYARYATLFQKSRGSALSISRLEQLFERTSLIWSAQAEKSQRMKQIAERKLDEFRDRLYNRDNMQRQTLKRPDRSRSRNKVKTKNTINSSKNRSMEQQQFSVRSSHRPEPEQTEMNLTQQISQLINQMEQINIQMESSSQMDNEELRDLEKRMNNLHFPKIIDLPYKVAVPNQLRNPFKQNPPKTYEQYLRKTEEKKHRMLSYVQQEIDLTDD